MASFNKVILIGNMVADPELKQTQQGTSVCSFSIAINRRTSRNADPAQQTVDFINIVTWRQTAEFVSKYFNNLVIYLMNNIFSIDANALKSSTESWPGYGA